MKFLYIILSILGLTFANLEIDIDRINNTNYKIFIDNQYYSCTPKSPPLSHSWSYNCVSNNHRNLRIF